MSHVTATTERETLGFLIENARRPQVDTDCEVIGINNPICSPLCVIPSILNNPHDPNQTRGRRGRKRERERDIVTIIVIIIIVVCAPRFSRCTRANDRSRSRFVREEESPLPIRGIEINGGESSAARPIDPDPSVGARSTIPLHIAPVFRDLSPSLSFSRRVPSSRYHFGIRRIDSMLIVRRLLRLLDVSTAETMRLRWRERVHTGFQST